MKRLLLALFIACTSICLAQKYADKEHYLVEGLEYDAISSEYQQLIDYYVNYYHSIDDELIKASCIYEIVRNCWDEKVWPLYNEWVFNYTSEILKKNDLNDSVRFTFNQLNIGTTYYEGWGHFAKGDYDEAIHSFEHCYQRYNEIGDEQGAANATDNIGSMYSTRGEFAKALEYHMQGLEIRERIKDTLGLGASYNAIGIVHMSHGDYFRAIEDLEKSADFHAKANYWAGVASAYSNLGRILTELEDYDQALEFHLESYQIKEQLEDKQGMTISLGAISEICVLSGDTALAVEYINYQYQLAEEIGDKRAIASALSYAGHIYFMRGKFEEGEKHCLQSLEIAEQIGSQIVIRGALTNLFLGYLQFEQYDKAEPILNRLVEIRQRDIKINFAILGEQQKEMYFNTMKEEFQNLFSYGHLVVEQQADITAQLYDNSLLLKGLLLQSTTAMREAILSSKDEKLVAKYDEWIGLKSTIADAYAKNLPTEELEEQANELEQELVKKSASFSAFQNEKTRSWKEVRNALTAKEAAIEFIRYPLNLGDPNSPIIYSALVVKPDSKQPELIDLCTEEELAEVLGSVSANNLAFVESVYGTNEQQQQKLSQLIWSPLAATLNDINKLYFAPEGLLHKVAFAAIQTKADQLLCDQFELVQMSSTAQLLKQENFELSANHTASLFGGVKYHTDSSEHVIWNYLPGTLKEIDSIQAIMSPHLKTNFYKAYDATEANFKTFAAESHILHIATHGFFYPDPEVIRRETKTEMDQEDLSFRGVASNYGIWNFVNNENPLMRSGLALAGANDAWQRDVFAEGEDGVLAAQEVSNLNLTQTELVVLSACETGLGDIKGSEGVYGLQRAFKMAGAHYLIMSLWQVPDEETAKFMTLFYDRLFELKDIRAAFTAAQLQMRKEHAPYYWAAFVLIE